jgi:hypothetical protein
MPITNPLAIYSHLSLDIAIECILGNSDVQGFVNPPRVKGRGQQGKGQGKDFITPNKPLTLLKGQGLFRGFSGVLISLILRYSRCCMPMKLSLNQRKNHPKRPHYLCNT